MSYLHFKDYLLESLRDCNPKLDITIQLAHRKNIIALEMTIYSYNNNKKIVKKADDYIECEDLEPYLFVNYYRFERIPDLLLVKKLLKKMNRDFVLLKSIK